MNMDMPLASSMGMGMNKDIETAMGTGLDMGMPVFMFVTPIIYLLDDHDRMCYMITLFVAYIR
jgi:hypothetical protein